MTEKDPYLGEYEAPEKTVEDLKKLYTYYRIENGRDDVVRQGNAFAHPGARGAESLDMADFLFNQQNILDSMEKRREERDGTIGLYDSVYDALEEKNPSWKDFGYFEEYDVSGCVEEPDAPKVHIAVWRLRESYKKGPYPVLFVLPGGGLFGSPAKGFCNPVMSKYLGCQIISVSYRTTVDAPYPAAVNDMHAVWQWMVDNAKEKNFDLNNVVLYGTSSGGHMASVLPFRLKRYGYPGGIPKGVVVDDGFFDDRETTRSMRMLAKTWCGLNNRAANMMYMGKNFASGFIGPEAYANHATVEECKNLPPYIIYAGQDNCGCDPGMQFAMKLNEAGIFCSFYMCGGATHVRPQQRQDASQRLPFMFIDVPEEYIPRTEPDSATQIENFIVNGVKDLFENDLRRKNAE